MKARKIINALLFPHTAIMILLIPLGAGLLTYSMLKLADTSPVRIGAYVIAFYALLVWCLRAPRIIRFFADFKNGNKYIVKWTRDVHLRINVTLSANVLWNGAYAALQLGTGIYHRSSWFYTLAAYYAMLAVMRFFLVRYTLSHRPGENMRRELKYYRACGVIFLIMNTALSGMMLHMIRENRVMRHHEVTTIAMAAYTFLTLTLAIINVIRYRKYNSPAMSAAKAVSLAAACVSMLTLENTMLTTFDKSNMTPQVRLLFLSLSGGVISAFIIAMAIYMLIESTRKINESEI